MRYTTPNIFAGKRAAWFAVLVMSLYGADRAFAQPCPGNCVGGPNHAESCLSEADCLGEGSICSLPASCVHLEWRPNSVVVFPDGVAELNLWAYHSADYTLPLYGIDVILNWDASRLQLVGKRDPCQVCSGGANLGELCETDADCSGDSCGLPDACFEGCPAQTYGWGWSRFPADCGLDGLNAPCPGGPLNNNDGDAFYQAISHAFCGQQEAEPAIVGPLGDGSGGLHITTFRFQTLMTDGEALVSIPLEQGDFTYTRVVADQWGYTDVGSVGPPARIVLTNDVPAPLVGDDTCQTSGSDSGLPCSTNADCAPPAVCGVKNRYITITPPTLNIAPLSIQVEIVSMPQFPNRIGEIWWAGPEVSIPNPPHPALRGARLLCEATPSNAQVWSNGYVHLFWNCDRTRLDLQRTDMRCERDELLRSVTGGDGQVGRRSSGIRRRVSAQFHGYFRSGG